MRKTNRGQAIIEYLMLFAAMSLIAVAMVRALNGAMGKSMSVLAGHLSYKLSSGVCFSGGPVSPSEKGLAESECFQKGYENK